MADWITEDASDSTSGKAPSPELKKGVPGFGWKAKAVEKAAPIIEAGAQIGGEILGGVVGGAAGGLLAGIPTMGAGAPYGMGAGTVAGSTIGAGVGQIFGEQGVKLLQHFLGLGQTPEQARRSVEDAFKTGAAYSVGGRLVGGVLGKIGSKVASIQGPQTFAPRLAGEAIEQSRSYTPLEREIFAQRESDVTNALLRQELGPASRSIITGSPRDIALENLSRPRTAPVLEARTQTLRTRMEGKVDTAIPTQPRARETVAKRIADYNQSTAAREAEIAAERQKRLDIINERRRANAEAAARGEEVAQEQQLLAQEAAYKADFERQFGVPFDVGRLTTEQQVGENIYSAAAKAEAVSKARFESDQFGYNQPRFKETGVAPEENSLTDAVDRLKASKELTPLDREKYIGPITKLEKLFSEIEETEAGKVVAPMELTYSDLRGIYSDLTEKARDAFTRGDRDTSRILTDLAKATNTTIEQLLSAADPALVKDYRNIQKMYRVQHVGSFREGEIGSRLLAGGKETGGERVGAAAIPKSFLNLDNANNLIIALGTEKAAARKGAAAIAPLTPELAAAQKGLSAAEWRAAAGKEYDELFRLGQEEAGKLMKPYFEDVLAGEYFSAGGGRAGAKRVGAWLRDTDNLKILDKYKLRDQFAEWGTRSDKLEAIMAAKKAAGKVAYEPLRDAQNKLVSEVLKVTNPDSVFKFLLNAPNQRQAYAQLMQVSPSAAYRGALKTVLRDGVKEKLMSGSNPFITELTGGWAGKPDPALRQLLPIVFKKSEIKTLKDFHTIMAATDPLSAKGMIQRLAPGTAEKLAETVATIPMGYGGYWAKHGILMALGKVDAGYKEAAIEFLDRAAVDPDLAEKFLAAYRMGNTGPLKKAIESIGKSHNPYIQILRKAPKAYMASEDISAEDMSGTKSGSPWLSEDEWRKAGE